MNYYDKLLLESNVELYNDRYNMAIGILESFGIELSEEAILESYGLSFLLEASDELSESEIDKTKKEIDNMKKKKDAKGLHGLCKRLGKFACKHKVAVGLFIIAATALMAYGGVQYQNYKADVAELSQKIIEHGGEFKDGELSSHELGVLKKMSGFRVTHVTDYIDGGTAMHRMQTSAGHDTYDIKDMHDAAGKLISHVVVNK